jgi:hypothetical protein
MDDLIDLAKHMASQVIYLDMPLVAIMFSFEMRGLSCTHFAEELMAGRQALWEVVCVLREKPAEQFFDRFGLAFEHFDHGLFSLGELPKCRPPPTKLGLYGNSVIERWTPLRLLLPTGDGPMP